MASQPEILIIIHRESCSVGRYVKMTTREIAEEYYGRIPSAEETSIISRVLIRLKENNAVKAIDEEGEKRKWKMTKSGKRWIEYKKEHDEI